MARKVNPNKEEKVTLTTNIPITLKTRFAAYCAGLDFNPSPSAVLAQILKDYMEKFMPVGGTTLTIVASTDETKTASGRA